MLHKRNPKMCTVNNAVRLYAWHWVGAGTSSTLFFAYVSCATATAAAELAAGTWQCPTSSNLFGVKGPDAAQLHHLKREGPKKKLGGD